MYPLHLDDIPDDMDELEELACRLAEDRTLFDNIEEEVWCRARESEEIPHFGNIYLCLLFGTLQRLIEEKYPDLPLNTNYYINAIDSGFYVNGEQIYDANQFNDMIMELEEASKKEIKETKKEFKKDIQVKNNDNKISDLNS